MTLHQYQNRPVHASFSLPAILAIICAVLSFYFGAVLGIIFAVAAIILGVIGALLALSPRVRGGIVSFVSIGAGVIGILAAVIKLLTLNF